MKKIAIVALMTLALFLVPNPIVPDEHLAAHAQAPAASGQAPSAEQEPLEVYVPSQKVSADASISFPVDI